MPPETLRYRIANPEIVRGSPGPSTPRIDISIDLGAARRTWFIGLVGYPSQYPIGGERGLRDLLLIAQRGLCGVCFRPMETKVSGGSEPTIDHVMPQASGGHANGNRVLAHRGRNHAKGDRWPTGCQIVFLAATNAAMESPKRKHHRNWERRQKRSSP